MTTISLAAPWTYRTPEVTVTFQPGDHDVTEDIAAAFVASAPKEEDDGNGTSEAGSPGPSGETEG